jgi:hypothetical protein
VDAAGGTEHPGDELIGLPGAHGQQNEWRKGKPPLNLTVFSLPFFTASFSFHYRQKNCEPALPPVMLFQP